MAVEDLIREWDANGDGAVTKMEFRQSLRNPKLELVADNVSELDALFDRLDKDKGGSLDLGEVKAAMKIMQTESAHAEKAVEKAKQRKVGDPFGDVDQGPQVRRRGGSRLKCF